jgi:hypothetical protein
VIIVNYIQVKLKISTDMNTIGECVNIHDSFIRFALSGIVKSIEWDDEREVRLLVRVRPIGRETIIGKTAFEKNKYPQPEFTDLYLGIPDEILCKCSFTVSPFNYDSFDDVEHMIRGFSVTKTCVINQSVMLVDSNR